MVSSSKRMVGRLEEAILHGDIVNIEALRLGLERQNLNRNEIKRQLNERYRVFSKKSAFICPCCNEPVNMNLTKEDGRPFYFKHLDGKKCTYSENSKTYENHVSSNQDKQRKDIGLTLFREILEGQLKPLGAEIERGYFYKKKLSFIPDFTVKFPFSDEVWAIDYYTSISQGSYTHNLSKRINTYREEGFKVFSFIDDLWLAVNEETDKGTLLSSEMLVAAKGKEDQNWDQFLNQDRSGISLQFIDPDFSILQLPIDTRSIAYVNTENRICKIIRFLIVEKNNRNLTFFKLSQPTITLERALTLNNERDNFLLFSENEEDLRQSFMLSLLDKIRQTEEEEKAKKEAIESLQRNVKIKFETIEKTLSEYKEDTPTNHNFRSKQISDEQIEEDMLARAKVANERPINMSPEEWEWYKKTGRTFSKESTWSIHPQHVPANKTQDEKVREELKDKLFSQPIRGDYFIDGPSANWRKFILKWISIHQLGENLTVSMKTLIKDMKDFGITFNQKDPIVQYPIKEFFLFYQRELKKVLKDKLNITFIE
jgi:hypothetical protein